MAFVAIIISTTATTSKDLSIIMPRKVVNEEGKSRSCPGLFESKYQV